MFHIILAAYTCIPHLSITRLNCRERLRTSSALFCEIPLTGKCLKQDTVLKVVITKDSNSFYYICEYYVVCINASIKVVAVPLHINACSDFVASHVRD